MVQRLWDLEVEAQQEEGPQVQVGAQVQGDSQDPNRGAPSRLDEVSSGLGEASSHRGEEEVSSHLDEVGAANHLGEAPSLVAGVLLVPSQVVVLLGPIHQVVVVLSGPILQVVVVPSLLDVGGTNLEAGDLSGPIPLAVVDPIHQGAEGPIHREAVVPIPRAAEDPSRPVGADPSRPAVEGPTLAALRRTGDGHHPVAGSASVHFRPDTKLHS